MEMSWKVWKATHFAAEGFAAPKVFCDMKSTVNPPPFFWVFTGPALASVSAQPRRPKKKRRKMPQKTRSDINIPSGTLPCLQTLTASIWKNGLNIHKIIKTFLKHICKISHICTFCQGADAPKDINTSNNSKWLMMHQSHCWCGQTWCQ